MHFLRLFLVPCLSAAAAVAQAPYLVGTRDIGWPNTSGQGTATLSARVHYPAVTAASNAAVLPRAGGWPVVVFLHGFATAGTTYSALANVWAASGFVVVLNNTATFDNFAQEADGRALYAAVVAANAAGPFAGALAVQRIGIAGHSMGGGNVGNVLASNPGYVCGICFAPVPPRGNNAALVQVPLGIVAGTGDVITPWQANSLAFYQGVTQNRGLKFFYLMNGDCSHTNVAGLFLSAGTATQVFQRAADVGLGFLRHWLEDGAVGLEAAIGPFAQVEPRLVSLTQAIADPQVFAAAPLRIGTSTRLSIAGEPGLGGAIAGFGFATPIPTPIGLLRLDPASSFVAVVGIAGPERRIDASISVPNDPGFVGLRLVMQAVGAGVGVSLLLGGATELVVLP